MALLIGYGAGAVNPYLAFESIEDPYLREKAGDIEDIGERVLRNLVGAPRERVSEIPEGVIVLARDHAGTLIGGYEPRPSPTAWPPGKSTQVAKTELPDAADRTRSEVFAGLSSIAE